MNVGYVLDTDVLIRFERSRVEAVVMFSLLRDQLGDVDFAMSTVTAMELRHGVVRATSEMHRRRREVFAAGIYDSVEVKDVTLQIAEAAGALRGRMAEQGMAIASEDLLIGTTALHLGYGVLTHNRRHFQMIPGLTVVTPSLSL